VNKPELAEAIAQDTGLTKADAHAAMAALARIVEQQLERGDEVNIAGFGKFKVTDRPARAGRNPSTGESIQIKAAKIPKFSPAASLKAAVNGGTRS
jgi:DNA-binding protein HU-beta